MPKCIDCLHLKKRTIKRDKIDGEPGYIKDNKIIQTKLFEQSEITIYYCKKGNMYSQVYTVKHIIEHIDKPESCKDCEWVFEPAQIITSNV